MLKDAGFEGVDFDLGFPWDAGAVNRAKTEEDLPLSTVSMDEIRAHYADRLKHLKENGLVISQAHAPFHPQRGAIPFVLDYAIDIYQKLILFCEEIGCPRLIIHGLCVFIRDNSITEEECEALNIKMYESLIPTLQKTNVTVCLENLYTWNSASHTTDFYFAIGSEPHKAAEIIDRLNEKAGKDCFGFCVDTGHVHMMRRRFTQVIPVLGKRIRAFHIHDNPQDYDSHLMPYTGSICWSEFVNEVKKVGYDGDLSFESASQVDARRVPDELVPAFLEIMARIGGYFRSQIQSQ
ncbi:MAG: sugar phosphate isomerase/epimerase [Clostridia bacterium]|nr:sugar phosphate isomerase/epimerase [Clostridia bacterium]